MHSKRVLIVGGSSGIGAAAASAFADQGAEVTISSRNPAKLESVAGRTNHRLETAVLDITRNDEVESFFARREAFDHVVVSAAQTATGPVRQLPLEAAVDAMDSKFWGAYRVARAARIQSGGSLTFVSGFLSVRPNKMSVLQGAINAALEALARGLALELSPVRVNVVSPGLIQTPLWSKMEEDARKNMFESASNRLPVRRVGQPEDVAQAIVYLASNGYATGSTVLVDGGGAIA
ncbi:SDR family oxidoreductase [Paraburkholderia largidicola]|uniref:Short-chain dehydrogenase/reductase n=1 Tax=Paraburkholderia largidicola TaxID=3014751 RepID=A0A7I8C3H7_9BURK|nr:SDR family oxidoreductase [Paraburkholderia sp. PGU16]BCF95051.1 short-chain dehydrogenase/reductase [Paraburkholderia sp. PGU16]